MPLLVAMFVTAGSLPAQDAETTDQAQLLLRAIRSQIDTLSEHLNDARTEADTLRAAISDAEAALARARTDQQSYDELLQKKHDELETVETENAEMLELNEQGSAALAASLRASWQTSRHANLRLLLEQEDPATITRRLKLHAYLNEAIGDNIRVASSSIGETLELVRALEKEHSELALLQQQARAHQQEMDLLQTAHSQTLSRLRLEIEAGGEQLTNLREDEQRLLELLRRIQQESSNAARSQQLFAQRKGNLDWPVPGTLFEQQDLAGRGAGIRWQGIFIRTTAEAAVTAVGDGVVVFADTFPNLGLLLIIDHGDGYMSLYGQADSLYRKAGDNVRVGDLVARTGTGGEGVENVLYFEMRHESTAVDPREWFRSVAEEG